MPGLERHLLVGLLLTQTVPKTVMNNLMKMNKAAVNLEADPIIWIKHLDHLK